MTYDELVAEAQRDIERYRVAREAARETARIADLERPPAAPSVFEIVRFNRAFTIPLGDRREDDDDYMRGCGHAPEAGVRVMAALLRVPGGVEPVAIDCACDDDAYSARIRRSLDNLRALGAPEAVIAHHEGILTATCAENARLQPREEIAMPHANVKADWHDIEEQTAFVPSGDGLDAARGIGWAVVLEGALLLALLGLVLLVGAVTHDSTGRVRAAVQEAQ